jgi:hypothetical protein
MLVFILEENFSFIILSCRYFSVLIERLRLVSMPKYQI